MYKHTFETTGQVDFYVIVSNNGASQHPGSGKGLAGVGGGTYLFKAGSPTSLVSGFNPSTYKTQITFDASSTTWVGQANAQMYVYDKSTGANYQMTASSNTWTVEVPGSVSQIEFYRCTPAGFGTTKVESSTAKGYWNKWSPSARGAKTTYKTSGDGSGSWQ